jgi:uncharacterized protein (UPF0332 family)
LDPVEFQETAKRLLSCAACEGDYRSCISRAYYSVFHAACEALLAGVRDKKLRIVGEISKRKNLGHDKVVRYLKRAEDDKVKAVGDALGNLRQDRTRADYDLWREFDRERAEDAIEDAEEQWQEIQSLTAERIGKAVEGYLSKMSGGQRTTT